MEKWRRRKSTRKECTAERAKEARAHATDPAPVPVEKKRASAPCMASVVDLITPPPTPVRDDSEDDPVPKRERDTVPSTVESDAHDAVRDVDACNKKQKSDPGSNVFVQPSVDADKSAPPPVRSDRGSASASASASLETTDKDTEEEVVVTKHVGMRPNVDFPHGRHNCGTHKFQLGSNASACSKCYCYVCDLPVGECKDWAFHCNAFPDMGYWEGLRKRGGERLLYERTDPLKDLTWTQFPEEHEQESLKLNTPLSKAQSTMLSFMVDIEKNGVVSHLFQLDKNCDLVGKIINEAYKNNTPVPWDTLYDLPKLHGGFLCSEVGAGKTGAVIGLIKAVRLARPYLTLIVVSRHLVDQWYQEFLKFDSELSIKKIYCNFVSEADIQNVDVVVINKGSVLHDHIRRLVRRIVVDESHETMTGQVDTAGGFVKCRCLAKHLHTDGSLMFVPVKSVWCLTSTPCLSWSSNALEMQGALICGQRCHMNKHATIVDAKKLMFRSLKNQFSDTTVPDVQVDKLDVVLNSNERELYDLIACVDTWGLKPLKDDDLNGVGADVRLTDRTVLRRDFLNENFNFLEKTLTSRMSRQSWWPDTMSLMSFQATVQKLDYKFKSLLKEVRKNRSKLDAIIEKIQGELSSNAAYKALVITSNPMVVDYFKAKSNLRVASVQPHKGKVVKRENKVKEDFQAGMYDVLICSIEATRVGVNLQNACQIFLIDITADDSVMEQIKGRISRVGTVHSKLVATFVVVRDTISELYHQYHQKRKDGVIMAEAMKVFVPDNPHKLSSPVETYRSISSVHDHDQQMLTVEKKGDKYELKLQFKKEPLFLLTGRLDGQICVGFCVKLISMNLDAVLFVMPRHDSSSGTLPSIELTNLNPEDGLLSSLPIVSALDQDNVGTSKCLTFHHISDDFPKGFKHIDFFTGGTFERFPSSNVKMEVKLMMDFPGKSLKLALARLLPLYRNMTIAKIHVRSCEIFSLHQDFEVVDVQYAGFKLPKQPTISLECVKGCLNLGYVEPTNIIDMPLHSDAFRTYFEKWNSILLQNERAGFERINPFFSKSEDNEWMFDNSLMEDIFKDKSYYAKAHVTVDDNVAIGDVIGFEFDSGHNGKESYEAFVREILPLPGIGHLVPVWVRAPKESSASIHILSSFKKS